MPSTLTAPATVLSAGPVTLPAPERGDDLQVRISAPATGADLPVIVFSHGFGESMNGYAPLVDHWAAHGFVVVQPTHLDSRTLGTPADDPRTPRIWRIRVDDLRRVIDELGTLEAAIPGPTGRVDRSRIAVAGHSWGAQTASTLLGARVLDANGVPGEDLSDARVRAGVLLALPGLGDDLTPFAQEQLTFMRPSFDQLTTPSLLVAGDADQSALTTRGPDWFTEAFTLSPGVDSLLTLFGAEHSLGGVSGYEAAETTDASPARVALVRQLTTAYLRDALEGEGGDWALAVKELTDDPDPLGAVRSK